MKAAENPPLKTRERLLISASRIFAEKGYLEATIAEICEQAGANIASVNYHFRDKENLYLEAWRFAFQQDLDRHPSDSGFSLDMSAEVRLAGRIRSLIGRIADPNSHFFAIAHREMAQQTQLLDKVMAQVINPEREVMNELVRELLGADTTEMQVKFCHASIFGQCWHLLKIKHLRLSDENQGYVFDMQEADAFADHVVQFSLAGIRALRESYGTGKKD